MYCLLQDHDVFRVTHQVANLYSNLLNNFYVIVQLEFLLLNTDNDDWY